MSKTVSNSGDLDGVTEYYHNRNQIIETRDGSGNLETQVYHGTQYIDEVVGQRIANMGRVYVHQDANYNVTSTTDLTARQIERNYYSPYGQLEVAVDSHPFDYDDDGDVDADDYAVTTNGTCNGTATGDCRRMDADADSEVDSTDQTTISNFLVSLTSDTELTRIPAVMTSQRGNAFGHQGLVFDAELASYQNRARQYAPTVRRFIHRDPLAFVPIAKSGFQDGQNVYMPVRGNPLRFRDFRGLDVANASNSDVWMFDSNCNCWTLCPPYSSCPQDTDAVGPYTPKANGKVFKATDCFDVTVDANGKTGIVWNPRGGSSFARKCCCKILKCAAAGQTATGGWVDPQGTFGSKPPNYP
ncbi:MAG: hypothetical protein DHS20C16_21990 [Phycisphaerae bacterium]|nr:MAG: hypothetical protein DHS20C16_21990 [Phycisphaerae bacterium]